MSPQGQRQVLIVLHQENSTPGRVGLSLRQRGFALDIRRPPLGEPLPATLAGHSAVVVFGGPMSANDPFDWVKAEIDWLGVPLRESVPLFGICLGAQMIARHLGARVAPHPGGLVERGYYPIRPTSAGRTLLDWPENVHHFHSEGFDLPRGATLLAEGDTFPNQAFALAGSTFGVQFHVELTLAMVHRWTTRGADRLTEPGGQSRGAHLEGRALHDHQTEKWLSAFLDRWLPS
ncbi:MAG: glutamine amidotransferase [Bauldia sp.]